MGCINSKNDINDVHPNIFRVVNIDEGGAALWTGQLEITEVELTLYRKGKDPTRWPLRTLRRYGFDADLFSFESGRRCPTGQGIYAFKCRRAEQLFHTLQSHIQIRNTRTDDQQNVSAEYPVPAVSNGPAVAVRSFTSQPVSRTNSQNQMLNGNRNSISSVLSGAVQNAQGQGANQSNDSNYLDPVPGSRNSNRRFSGGIRLSSIGSGPLSPEVVSPGSPSSTNILEVTPLNPLPTPLNHGVSNLYQVTEFLHRENNNNKKFAFQHSYTNSSAIAGHTCTNTQTTNTVETDSLTQSINRLTQKHRPPPLAMQTAYINIDPSSPQSPSPSEPYAMLDLDAEGCHHLYMNVGADAPSTTSITTSNHFNSGSLVMRYKPGIVTSSNTAPHWPIQEIEEEMHCYENLEPGEINQFVKRQFSKPDIFCKVDLPDVCTTGPQTPLLGTLEVNYIVLDLDQSRTDALVSQSSPTQSALPPESPHKPAAGYATIDFNKTVALSNSATPCSELDSEGSRKTRHNSTIGPARHSNSISE